MSDPLVSTALLAGHLGDPDVLVIDATWFMPGDPRSGREEYLKGHIPGAVFFDIDASADQSSTLPHMLPSAAQFAQQMGDTAQYQGTVPRCGCTPHLKSTGSGVNRHANLLAACSWAATENLLRSRVDDL